MNANKLIRILTPLLLAVSSMQAFGESEVADSVTRLGELSVVAIKQTDALRDEAMSGSVLGRVQLEEMNATAIKNMSDAVPNLYIPDYGSRITSTIYVRGIGARIDQPAVGLVVDNVPLLNKNAYDFDLADIASVEVLRGPQSTLYGRNTIGGLINITTISPMRMQGLKVSLLGATGNDWRASIGWYGRPSDKFATAVNGSFSYLGGFFRNKFNDRHVDKELSAALRWKADLRLSESVFLHNALSTSLLRQGGYPYEYIKTGEINYNDTCFYRRFLLNDGLTLNWRSDRFTMTSITSVQYLDDNMTLDQDFLPLPYFTLTQKQKETGVTEDIVFRGNAMDGKYRWVAGLFGFYKQIRMEAPVMFLDSGISELIESHRNDANPDYPISWDTRQFRLGSLFTIPTGGVAAYHQSEFRLGRWNLSAGIRLDWERSGLDYTSTSHTGYQVWKKQPDGALLPHRHISLDIDDRGVLHRSYFNWLPRVSALYNLPLEGENNVYLSIAKGYKAGGFNTQMFSEVLQQRLMNVMGVGKQEDIDDVVGYRPEYSWNYELGSHLSFPRAHLDIDLSLFYIDCRDQQLTMFPPGTTTGRMMTNAGRTRSLGGEATCRWQALESLSVMASYGYTDARFVDFRSGVENYRGKIVPYAPRNTIFAQAEYSLQIRHGFLKAIDFEVNTRANGPIYWNESNSSRQDLYALLGASVTFRAEKWGLQVWGRNLTDTRYTTFYFMSMGNEFVQRGRPLQLGATLRLFL